MGERGKNNPDTADRQWHPSCATAAGCPLPHKDAQRVLHLHAQHRQIVPIYHQRPSSSRSAAAPRSPPTSALFLLFEQTRGIFTAAVGSPAGSPPDLPRYLEMCLTTQQGNHRSPGEGQEFPMAPNSSPSNHLSAAQEEEQPRLLNPSPQFWCSQPSHGAGAQQVALRLSEGARSQRTAQLHASAAAATARLNRKSEAKNCISSAR